MESHDLPIQRIDVRQRLAVVEIGEPLVPHDGVDFGLGFGLNIRVEHHHVDERPEGRESLRPV